MVALILDNKKYSQHKDGKGTGVLRLKLLLATLNPLLREQHVLAHNGVKLHEA